jgi:kynurenine formamidase
MRIVDLSMTVEECDSAPFAPDETYFKIKPYINWDEKGFVSNFVHMTVHAWTHIDSPHHFFRDKPSIERLPLEPLIGNGVVLDLTFQRLRQRAHHARGPRPRRTGTGRARGQDRSRRHFAAAHRLAERAFDDRSQVVERFALSHQRSAQWLVKRKPA